MGFLTLWLRNLYLLLDRQKLMQPGDHLQKVGHERYLEEGPEHIEAVELAMAAVYEGLCSIYE